MATSAAAGSEDLSAPGGWQSVLGCSYSSTAEIPCVLTMQSRLVGCREEIHIRYTLIPGLSYAATRS